MNDNRNIKTKEVAITMKNIKSILSLMLIMFLICSCDSKVTVKNLLKQKNIPVTSILKPENSTIQLPSSTPEKLVQASIVNPTPYPTHTATIETGGSLILVPTAKLDEPTVITKTAKIILIPKNLSLYQNNSNQIRVIIKDNDGNEINKEINYELDKQNIIKVTKKENNILEIEGRDTGNVNLTVRVDDISESAKIDVMSQPDYEPGYYEPGYKEKIAFHSDRDGNNEIYVMNVNGSNQTRLTNNPAVDEIPSWSPDGAKIAFMSNRDGNYEIYVMNTDGSNQTRLTNNPANDYFPNLSPDGNKILFGSTRDGNWELYVMNVDGSNVTRLTNNPADDVSGGNWSPDGSKIVFASFRDGNYEIYVMNTDGSNQTRLTNNPAGDQWPICSPDGSKIVFYSDRDGNFEIYVMNVDGSNQTILTNNPASDFYPSWFGMLTPPVARFTVNPPIGATSTTFNVDASGVSDKITSSANLQVRWDWENDGNYDTAFSTTKTASKQYTTLGVKTIKMEVKDEHGMTAGTTKTVSVHQDSKITFTSNRDGNNEIYIMNTDGFNQTRLTNNLVYEDYPNWSPDASKIAFMSNRDVNDEIYIMNADGSNQTRLTNNPASDNYPGWSPDGSKIVFLSIRDGNNEIYIMNADGSNQTRLTNNPANDNYPGWSPDGSKIVFSSNRDGNWEIYIMNTDGSNQTRLINNPANDNYPGLSPDGSKIIFHSDRDGDFEVYIMNADGSNQTRLTNNGVFDAFPSW